MFFLTKKLLLRTSLVIIKTKEGLEMKKKNENPLIKGEKIKKINSGNISEDENEIKAFIIIVIVIAVLIGVIYGLTELFKKDESKETSNIVTGSINYDKISVGTLLNRPYEEYYVLAYSQDDSKAVLYSTILTKYMQNSKDKDYIKIYYLDLNSQLNKEYYDKNNDGKSNAKAKEIEDLDFGDLTLIKIKKGQIKKYIEDFDTIKDLLK